MHSIPKTSLSKLSRLRNRERLYRVLWGFTRWLAVVLTLGTVALLIDWSIDIYQDTPMWVRVPLTLLQVVVFAVTAWIWVLRPAAIGPSLIKLARRVEENILEFDHRLITSIQLTHVEAKTQGMSVELIGIVTEEAELISGKHDLARLADARRLKWSAALVAWPLAILAFLLLFFKPALLVILLQRQCLLDVEIPRDIQLKSATAKIWPAGDQVVIRYEVASASSRIDKDMKGQVFVAVAGQPDAEYELSYEDSLAQDKAIFTAKVPHSSVNFKYRARLGDGRTKQWDEVVFEPRPAVTIFGSWVSLPDYVPNQPDGKPYEIESGNGDVKGFNRSRARVRIYVQKEFSEAKLSLFARSADGFTEVPAGSPLDPDAAGTEILPDGSKRFTAEFSFPLRLGPKEPKLIAYRVAAKDHYGFSSLDNPRRSIDVSEPDVPYVGLLPERFPPELGLELSEDYTLEGMPTPLGGSIPIEYYFRSPVGAREPTLGRDKRLISPARLMFRILDREGKDGPWNQYVLDEVLQTPESGEFDLRQASFSNLPYQKTVLKNRVEFHARPTPDPSLAATRASGGGRFDFSTAELKKPGPDGQEVQLEIGDKIEYYLEVFDRDPAAGRPAGRSEPRLKEICSPDDLLRLTREKLSSDDKLRDLEKRQQGVFARPKN